MDARVDLSSIANAAVAPRLVHLGAKHELPGNPARQAPELRADRPARDDLGKARDVLLSVAARDSERVQLENLARKILIDAEAPLARTPRGALRQNRIRANGSLIVQIQEHRRMARRGEQQIREAAEDPRPDCLALEAAGEPQYRRLIDRNREVIGPKIGEVLQERPIGRERRADARGAFVNINWPVELSDFHDDRGVGSLRRIGSACRAPLAP